MTLRLSIALVLLAQLVALPALAEERGPQHLWEITPIVGIGWGGKIDFEDDAGGGSGEIDFDSGPVIGGVIGARVSEEGMGFISYQFQRTSADVRWDGGSNPNQAVDVNVGMIQIGGELELPMNPHFVPFFGLGIGATHIGLRDNDASPEWFFSGTVSGGAKFPITKHFGLRLHMSMLATVIQNDSAVLCVSSGGLTCAVSADLEAMIQGDFMAGVYLAF